MSWAPIEGETPIDPSGLKSKFKWVTNRQELSEVEAENIRKPLTKYLTVKPNAKTASFTFGWCLGLHKEMYGKVWTWAGNLRNYNGQNLGMPCHQISESLAALLSDLENWTGYGMDMLEQAVRLHHRSVFIHPFQNGNGRWSRLLANIWLRRNGLPVIDWPEPEMGCESSIRSEYIAALKTADHLDDYEPLIAIHRRYSGKSTLGQ